VHISLDHYLQQHEINTWISFVARIAAFSTTYDQIGPLFV